MRKLGMRFGGIFAVSLCVACGSGGEEPDVNGTLIVEPATAEVTVVNGAADALPFRAFLLDGEGNREEITERVNWSSASVAGSFTSNEFTASGNVAGEQPIVASLSGASGGATVTINVTIERIDDGLPSNIADMFANATAGATFDLAYPPKDAMLPPNLGRLETHWNQSAGPDVARVEIAAPNVSIVSYQALNNAEANHVAETPYAEWQPLQSTASGTQLSIDVKTMVTATSQEYTSATTSVKIAEAPIEGGIYYWDSKGLAIGNGTQGAVMRHDMAKPEQDAELFYPDGQNETRCVGCHALSRDGSKMAVRYDGGVTNKSNVVDVADGTRVYPGGQEPEVWTYAAFAPDNVNVVVSDPNGLTVVNSETGARTALHAGKFTQHDVSPKGDKIVYVTYQTDNALNTRQGSIIIADLDLPGASVTNPVTLAAGSTTVNNFYPTFSPDGEWILFNRDDTQSSQHGNSNDNPNAELWVVKADNSGSAIKLELPNLGKGLHNSWPKWTPFEQTEGGQSILWFTFSTRREVGVNNAAKRPQLWMAPFFPDAVATGGEISAPAFWLPFQNIAHGNHIAQWTEKVVTAID